MNFLALDTNSSKILYSSSKNLSIFAYFLIDDVGGRTIDSLFLWLHDNNYESAVLNYSYIKKNGSKISISCFYDGYEREDHPERDKFEIETLELIKIAIQWQELYTKYRYIKITEEDGQISLSGSEERN
ncbi:MAG: hypothetical protein ACD_82C00159G0003 [uncultured bacterium]|nr:MAG: hypothetical protein ACD_82C00159G0003 [uncultured bacterium]